MSDVKFSVANTSNLAQRLQSTEKSLEFIQREHASTLSNLHDELAKWQQKYSGSYNTHRLDVLLSLHLSKLFQILHSK